MEAATSAIHHSPPIQFFAPLFFTPLLLFIAAIFLF
jgi:hypothetical protein